MKYHLRTVISQPLSSSQFMLALMLVDHVEPCAGILLRTVYAEGVNRIHLRIVLG